MPINQPSNQIKLTNVSVVRLKKAGKRFELACYKNKVMEWRSGVEKDLDEVVQISNVFSNVSKGQVVNSNDLEKAFGKVEMSKVIGEILNKGELQVGDKERSHALDQMSNSIAHQVTALTINPTSGRPYPVSLIEKAMSELHFSCNLSKSSKAQALEVIKLLRESDIMPIKRAEMRVRLTMPSKDGKRLKEEISKHIEKVEEEDWSEEWELIAVIEPGAFKIINEILSRDAKGKGRLETLTSSTHDGEERLE